MSVQSIHAFAEKVALITDGDDPIGRAVALQLALQGAYVVIGFSQISESSKSALAEMQNLGTLASAVEGDITSVAGAKNLVGAVEGMFGRLDLLINCLKFRDDSIFEETTDNLFERTLGSNLKAAFLLTHEAVRLMKTRPKPKIDNVASALNTPETKQNVLFAASQTALVGLTESLAKTLPKNFRVNAIALSEKKTAAENLDAELFRPKSGVSADDAARAVCYLLSAEAIGLNGQILKIE